MAFAAVKLLGTSNLFGTVSSTIPVVISSSNTNRMLVISNLSKDNSSQPDNGTASIQVDPPGVNSGIGSGVNQVGTLIRAEESPYSSVSDVYVVYGSALPSTTAASTVIDIVVNNDGACQRHIWQVHEVTNVKQADPSIFVQKADTSNYSSSQIMSATVTSPVASVLVVDYFGISWTGKSTGALAQGSAQTEIADFGGTYGGTVSSYKSSIVSGLIEMQEWSENTTVSRFAATVIAFEAFTAGDSAAFLDVKSAKHLQKADSNKILQTHNLTVTSAKHLQKADNNALNQTHELSVNSAKHLQKADQNDLVQTHNLFNDSAKHLQKADQNAISQVHNLSVNSAKHLHKADNIGIEVLGDLRIQSAKHLHKADSNTLNQTHELGISSARHRHTADIVYLSYYANLSVKSAKHVHISDANDIGQTHYLKSSSAKHLIKSDSVLLTQLHKMQLLSARHRHTVDFITWQPPVPFIPHPDLTWMVGSENMVYNTGIGMGTYTVSANSFTYIRR